MAHLAFNDGRAGWSFFNNLLLLCRAIVELRCRPRSAALYPSASTTSEAFPKRGTPCWRPLFSALGLLS